MKRCKARNEEDWRCVRPEHEGDQHGYQFVPKIRLPKSQMRLLHSFRASLIRVEAELCNEDRTNFILTALKARDELLAAIAGLEDLGRTLASEHSNWVNGDLHWGHKVCFYNEGKTCLSPEPEPETSTS